MRKRRHNRREFYQILKDRGYRFGAEVGVQYGLNAIDLLEFIPDLYLYLVDPWCCDNRRHTASESKALATANLAPYSDRIDIGAMTSQEAAPTIDDGFFDFVYIDGDHRYDAVMLDIILWGKKVRPGGILCGHDYADTNRHGVKRAVDDYARYHNLKVRAVDVNWYWEVA